MKMAWYPSQLLEATKNGVPPIIPTDQFVQKFAVRTAKSVQVCAHSRRMAHLDLKQ